VGQASKGAVWEAVQPIGIRIGSLGAFKKSFECVQLYQFLFTNSPVSSVFRLYFLFLFFFYCRRIFVSIALEKSLCFLLGRILCWQQPFRTSVDGFLCCNYPVFLLMSLPYLK